VSGLMHLRAAFKAGRWDEMMNWGHDWHIPSAKL
jgi:hypothetical protein